MNTELERRKQEITRSQGRRKLWQRIVSALAAVVMFVTTYVLILPVEAQNRTFCEMEAHEHSAENGCYVETKTLKCTEEHEHTDECYITLLTLICQHEEHTHNKECYADKTADIETQADWEASIKAAKLTGNWSEDILAVASTQLGYRESEKNYIVNEQNEIKGYTRYGDWIGDKYTDWSAAFVAFCLNYTGISKDEMTYDKAPEEWVKALQNQKLYNESIEEVNPGDIVFIDENGDNKADRVGIVVENTEGKIKTVEGDLNNSVAYFEYQLSAQTARTDVDSSNEESNNSAAAGNSRADQTNVEFSDENSNNKDFSEEKSTTGRAGREASQTHNIIGSVSLPENPNYNPPITITDPENTTSPDDRIKETPSPENRINPTIAPTTPPEGGGNRENSRAPREYIAPEVPVLTGINSTTTVAIIYQHPSTGRRVQQYTTLEQALDGVEQAAGAASEFTVVFTQNYTMSAADGTAMATDKKGSSASKIYFTSCYNNGTADVTSAFAPGNYFIANTETEIYNLTFSGACQIQGGGNKLTIGTGVVGNTSSDIWGGLLNANLESDTDLSVFSGTWAWIGGGSYRTGGAYTLTGNSNCYIGGTVVTNCASGGSHSVPQTGNTSLIIGGSAQVTTEYCLGGSCYSTITGNTSLLATDDAVVYCPYGGSYDGAILGDETTFTINGRARVTLHAVASSFYNVSHKITANISGQADVTTLYSGAHRTVLTGAQIIYNIDGTDGAHVNEIYAIPNASYGNIQAGVDIDVNVKNMKDIRLLDAATRNSGSGKVTIEGDCGVQYYFYTNENTDLELAANATLQMGSNSDLTQAGSQVVFGGQMEFLKSLIMNANSKLIMAGDSADNAYCTIKDIDVRGAGAEIDIYKRAATTYPIQVSGEKLGTEKLKLGIFKAQDVDTDDPSYGDVLLTFSAEANAKEENHAPGAVTKGSTYEYDLDGVHKDGNNIIVCKLLDEPIDISKGRLEFGNIYDDSDPANPIRNAVQYTGDNTTVYAHDHSLKPKYSIMGNYATAWNYPGIWVKPKTEVELFLMSELTIVTAHRACILVSDTDTTLTLQDMPADRKITLRSTIPGGANHNISGCIVKNGMTGTLTIRCEHAGEVDASGRKHICDENICGKLDCLREGSAPSGVYGGWEGFHLAGIGSSASATDPTYGVGFANLYIKGGVINIPRAEHTPAIGVNCATTTYDRAGDICYTSQSEAVTHGSMCKNINISGGRVYAYGGNYCPAIGGAIAASVDGVYISGGAYVYAEGGYDSPGIGVAGFAFQNGYSPEYGGPTTTEYETMNKLRNFVVTGGETVVVALGGQYSGGFVPGVGIGYFSDNGAYYGESSNTVATPDAGYMAIIQQGNGNVPGQLPFIPNAPSATTLEVPMGTGITNYGTLIYFAKIEKTASVNGGAEAKGTELDPVMVNVGDTVKYIIRTGEIADSNGAVTGSLVDVLPEGMTFSGSGASPASGFSYSYDNSTKRYTVRWDNVNFSTAHEFSVNVTVNNLPAGVNEKTFENQAVLVHSDGTNEIPLNSNWTYHKVVRQAPPEFDLTIEKTVVGAGTGPFSFEITFADGTGAAVSIPQPAANSGYTVTNNVASFDLNKDESVTITGIPVDTVATIVETSHAGYTVQYNFSDGTPSVSGDTASVTITDDLTVTCINNAGFELPHTGGTGSLILTLGGVILVATALMYGISAKRRQWRAWI